MTKCPRCDNDHIVRSYDEIAERGYTRRTNHRGQCSNCRYEAPMSEFYCDGRDA